MNYHLELDPSKVLSRIFEGVEYFEKWGDIPEYEGIYQVSTFGRVKSLERLVNSKNCKRIVKEKILKRQSSTHGYSIVGLHKNNKQKTFPIHQLVATTFLGHKPNGHSIVVDHIDNYKLNNTLENLQIILPRENCSKDKFRQNNSSKYVGVWWNTNSKIWMSAITINEKINYLGSFNSEKEASKYYQDALKCINEGRIENIKVKRTVYSSKYLGVFLNKKQKKWIATIKSNYIGSFSTEEEAYQATLPFVKLK